MKKNTLVITALAVTLPVLTVVVWLIWLFVLPTVKQRFLNFVSNHVEKTLYGEQKAKAAKKRRTNARKPYGKR